MVYNKVIQQDCCSLIWSLVIEESRFDLGGTIINKNNEIKGYADIIIDDIPENCEDFNKEAKACLLMIKYKSVDCRQTREDSS